MKFTKLGIILLLMSVLVVSGCSDSGESSEEVSEIAENLGVDVVSTSFDDFGAFYCDPESSPESAWLRCRVIVNCVLSFQTRRE